jgi:hypothetical protein
MPYISANDDRREKLRNGESALTAGELNYQIFYYVKHNKLKDGWHLKELVNQFLGEKPNYQKYNDMTGCLVRCYKEIKRRKVSHYTNILLEVMDSYDDEIAKYEDKKIEENGDVE